MMIFWQILAVLALVLIFLIFRALTELTSAVLRVWQVLGGGKDVFGLYAIRNAIDEAVRQKI
jgi:hypothetical protein